MSKQWVSTSIKDLGRTWSYAKPEYNQEKIKKMILKQKKETSEITCGAIKEDKIENRKTET